VKHRQIGHFLQLFAVGNCFVGGGMDGAVGWGSGHLDCIPSCVTYLLSNLGISL